MTTYTVDSHLQQPPPHLQYIPVNECEQSAYIENPDDKAVLGVLLKILHSTASENSDRQYRYNGQMSYVSKGNARQRQVGARYYDRMLTFGDILDPGKCFVIILDHYQDTVKLLRYCKKSMEGVGNIFIITEPNPVVDYLGESTSVPIIQGINMFIPINNPLSTILPTIPPIIPDADHTMYFTLHNNSICCNRTTLQQASCTGYFCDRQSQPSPTQKCGCIYMATRGLDHVLVTDIIFCVPPSFQQNERSTVLHFRSWKFSKIFIPNDNIWPRLHADNHEQLLRQSVKNITDFVNRNGGWTIVGWIRCGHVADHSTDTTTTPTLQSRIPRLHISYIYPTNNAIIHDQNLQQHQITQIIAGQDS